MASVGDTIVNPRTGQRMTFLQTARSSDGALLQVETVNPPHTEPEPAHVHPRQESRAEVVAGVLHFNVQGVEHVVGPGESIVILANTPHYFWNGGEDDARAIQELRPALHTERFFETWFGLARDGKLDQRGMPSLLQLAVLLPAYSDVMRPVSPPWPVLRLISLLLGPIAKVRGYRSVYPRTVEPSVT